MTTESLIDRAISDILDLNAQDSYIATEWRPRILLMAQIVVSIVLGDGTVWTFMQDSGTVQLAAGSGLLPANFGKFPQGTGVAGVASGVYVSGARKKVTYRPWALLVSFRELTPSTGPQPDIYTVYGRDTTTGQSKLECYPGDNSLLNVYYQRRRPTLTDADPGGLEEIPEEYHESVIYQGLHEWLSGGISDPRSPTDFSNRFQLAFGLMKREQQVGDGETDNRVGDYGISQMGMY